ncbi:MAG: hypothetical protein RLZZ58_1900, partial [Pseudomonadota bacterium]
MMGVVEPRRRASWGAIVGMACAFAGAFIGVRASAQDVAITNARLVIGDGSAPISGGTVVVRGGKVVAAGASVKVPADMSAIDADGAYVTPGLIAGFSRLGLVEVDAVDGTNDRDSNKSLFTAAIDVTPALNPFGSAIAVNRAGGVTRALVFPGDSAGLFQGQGALVDLGADADMVTRPRLFQYVEFGESGARTAGGSRSATFLTFRTMLAEARDYARNPAGYDGRSKDSLLLRADAAALGRVLDGRDRLFIKADRAADILNVLKLRAEFPAIRMSLVGASEGWTVAAELAASGVPVMASAMNDLPASFEKLASTQSNVGRMKAAGVDVTVALFDDDDAHKQFYLTQYAGNMVALTRVPGANGLS